MALNYTTTADLQARLENDAEAIFLTDGEGDNAIDTAVLDEVLDDAEGEADSYYGVLYAVPAAVAGDAKLAARMKSVTLDLALEKLCVRSEHVSEKKEAAAERAREWLKSVAKGEAVPPSARTEASTVSRDPLVDYGVGSTGAGSTGVSAAVKNGFRSSSGTGKMVVEALSPAISARVWR